MPTTRRTDLMSRLRAAAAAARLVFALVLLTIVTAVIAMITDWRARFDPPLSQGSVLSEWALNGSAISAPVAPVVVYLAAALLAMRQDRWRVLGLVLIALGGVVTIIGGLGELVAEPSAETPRAVLVVAGPFYMLFGAAMIVLAVRDLVRRRPTS